MRPRLSPAIATIAAHSPAGLRRWTHRVGASGRARDKTPHPETPSGLARRLATASTFAMGELSPWRSVLPPLGVEGDAFAAEGGNVAAVFVSIPGLRGAA